MYFGNDDNENGFDDEYPVDDFDEDDFPDDFDSDDFDPDDFDPDDFDPEDFGSDDSDTDGPVELTENQKLADEYANKVLDSVNVTILSRLRFFHLALNVFKRVRLDEEFFGTDGKYFCYELKSLLKGFFDSPKDSERQFRIINRRYLHCLLHCVFVHNFVPDDVKPAEWDLACDIAVESVINDLDCRVFEIGLSREQTDFIKELKKNVNSFTAFGIYEYYTKNKKLTPLEISDIRQLFYSDNHELWYMTDEEKYEFGIPRPIPGDGEDGDGSKGDRQSWKRISDHILTELESFSKFAGTRPGSLTQNLKDIKKEEYDYRDFLKKFAVMNEVVKLNPDEFDYIYYSYGMHLYGRSPFVEPLEYKEEKRIREFVVAIDTSGSVHGDLVQTFLQKTFNILKSEESYTERVNIHIIQCDTQVQEHVKIQKQEELDDYMDKMVLRGFGGTDFRPVFSLVSKLIDEKEFSNLKGLIYFTDGYGVFPEKKPPYETAFVFIKEHDNNLNVPPWAVKLVLSENDIKKEEGKT